MCNEALLDSIRRPQRDIAKSRPFAHTLRKDAGARRPQATAERKELFMALSGTDDEGTPLVIKEGVDLIPGCEWTLIQGAPHIANVMHPRECLEAVEGFISRFE